jgi:hypothetical protein
MHYSELPDEKYIYYECFMDSDGLTCIENENRIEQKFF